MAKGRKDDAGKLRWSLFDLPGLEEVLRVSEGGAKEYGDNNYRKVPNKRTRYYNALMRHIVEWRKGRTHDRKSKRFQMAHVAWNALALLEFDMKRRKR